MDLLVDDEQMTKRFRCRVRLYTNLAAVQRTKTDMDRLIGVHPIERLRFVARGGWAGPSELAAEAAWALADLACYEAPALVPACRRLLDRQPSCGPLWWVAARVLDAGDPAAEAQRCAQALEDDITPERVIDELPDGARVVQSGGIGELASADLVLVEVDALGPTGMLVDASTERLLASAVAVEVPVWVEAGVGRVLPPRIWDVISRRVRSSTRFNPAGEDEDATHELRRVLSGLGHPSSRVGSTATRGGLGQRTRYVAFGAADDLGSAAGVTCRLVDLRGVEKVVGPRGARSVDIAIRECDCPEPPELIENFPTTAGGLAH